MLGNGELRFLRPAPAWGLSGAAAKFIAHDRHLGRGLNAQTDFARLDGDNLNGDVQAGEDDLLLDAASEDQHSQNPFQAV
jgi:hypothetical protein